MIDLDRFIVGTAKQYIHEPWDTRKRQLIELCEEHVEEACADLWSEFQTEYGSTVE